MLETELTPDNCAMVLIDHQTHLMVRWPEADYQALKRSALGLAGVAKIFKLPLVLTAVRKGRNVPGGPFLPEITKLFPDVKVIQRTKLNSWKEPEVREAVAQTGRKKLIMAGVAADFGVVMPALYAAADGYEVRVVLDASGTWNPMVTATAIARLTHAGIMPTNWVAVAGELQEDWANEATGRPLVALLKEHLVHWASKDAQARALRNSPSTMSRLGSLFDRG